MSQIKTTPVNSRSRLVLQEGPSFTLQRADFSELAEHVGLMAGGVKNNESFFGRGCSLVYSVAEYISCSCRPTKWSFSARGSSTDG